eukprot:RCo044867
MRLWWSVVVLPSGFVCPSEHRTFFIYVRVDRCPTNCFWLRTFTMVSSHGCRECTPTPLLPQKGEPLSTHISQKNLSPRQKFVEEKFAVKYLVSLHSATLIVDVTWYPA